MKLLPQAASIVTLAVLSALAQAAEPTQSVIKLDIEAQPISEALNEFARQTGLQVVIDWNDGEGIASRPLKGTFTSQAALEKLLAGTDLTFQYLNDRIVAVSRKGKESGGASQPRVTNAASQTTNAASYQGIGWTKVAISDSKAQIASTTTDASSQQGAEKKIALEEVIVTGSHIRGVEVSASPVYRFDREDLAQSGISTTEQFLQSLPQNFGGGNSFSTVGGILGGEDSNLNYGQGTGVNLRGMGSESTLVLVNGRRVAPAGIGNFVDISMIPIGAVERMEVLADGASAIYGSDAVAGVVNILLRTDLQGAESRVRYGSTSAGGNDELQLGQMFGASWSGGSAMLSYDYFERTRLDSERRDFTRTYHDQTDLIPAESRHGVLATLEQQIGDRQVVFANATYSERESESSFNSGFGQSVTKPTVQQYGGALGTALDFGNSWRVDLAGSYSKNDTLYNIVYSDFGYSLDQSSKVWAVDAKADGALFDITGGAVRLALGSQHRNEAFESVDSSRYRGARDVTAAFAELFVPMVGAANATQFARRIEFTLAARYENYSDFGSTFDPKFGLLWAPVNGVNLRGTVGTSFRSPLLSELRPSLDVTVAELPDPSLGSLAPALLLHGGTGVLGPEQATTWTAGIDFEPESMRDLKLSLTYFDIDFKDRISQAVPNSALYSVLTWEDRYAAAITRNPDLPYVRELYSQPTFWSPGDVPAPEEIVAIIDNRPRNLARRSEKGIDLTFSHALAAWGGTLSAQLAGTYLFSLEEQVTRTAPSGSLKNTLFYPVDLRMRGNLSWTREGWGASAALSYVDSYRDRREGLEARIGSWTTIDVTARYNGFSAPHLRGTEIALSVLNVFDKAPPFVYVGGLNFDATNANALGRFIALQLTHTW